MKMAALGTNSFGRGLFLHRLLWWCWFAPCLSQLHTKQSKTCLLLSLSHPVEASRDHFLTLKQVDTLTWTTKIKSDIGGRWYLRLSALDDEGGEEWRMQGEISLSQSLSTQLR